MSSNDPKRNPSQAKPEGHKPSTAPNAQGKHRPNGKPLPFDDDDTGNSDNASETSNPQTPPMDHTF